jgi:hypothetical protein
VHVDAMQITGTAFRKSLAVEFSGGAFKPLGLYIIGTIDRSREITIFPAAINLGELSPGDIINRSIFVRGPANLLASLPKIVNITTEAEQYVTFHAAENSSAIDTRQLDLAFTAPLTSKSRDIEIKLRFLNLGEELALLTAKASLTGSLTTPERAYLMVQRISGQLKGSEVIWLRTSGAIIREIKTDDMLVCYKRTEKQGKAELCVSLKAGTTPAAESEHWITVKYEGQIPDTKIPVYIVRCTT